MVGSRSRLTAVRLLPSRGRRAPGVARRGPAPAALLLAVAALTAGAAPGAGATVRAPTPRPVRATPTPGMGSPVPCATAVSYTVNGKAITPHPLPAPASRVGGAALAEPGRHVTPGASVPPPFPHATAWLVADVATGQVLAACNAHVPLAPASTLKVLTALALHPRIDAGVRYTARDEDARVDGTRVGLVPGSVYTVDNLWHALLMGSANDAAVALGQLAGGTAAATGTMLTTARALGADDTTPHNTSGLDLPGQVSSAYDLALFGRAALADPQLAALLATRAYAFPEAGTATPGRAGAARRTFQIQNHDRLLANYPGAIGGKNGWTSTTGGSFVAEARRGARTLLVTVLAADPETWHMCAALLDWGFSATPAGAPGVGRLVSGPDPDGALTASTAAAAGDGAHPAPARAAGGSGDPSAIILVAGAAGLLAAVGGVAVRSSRRRRLTGRGGGWGV